MKSKRAPDRRTRVLLGQPSWRLATSEVEAFVTERGGHLGPVTFCRKGQAVQPYAVAPWAEERTDPGLLPLLRVLRGDFFCLPFGGNATPLGQEKHPVHGETANANWRFESLREENGCTELRVSLKTRIRPGRVDKVITLREGHNAVYSRHIVSGMTGAMNLGHHAMLKFPDPPGSGVLSTSPFVYGQVFPGAFEMPENGGYSSLKAGAEFQSLERVPTADGGVTDLTRYPARRGFEDLALLVSDDAVPFAWTAVTFPRQRYVWFSLKDPRVLRETVFWFSNGGRHYPPWNGRHLNVMGLEEVTSYFHYGLAESTRRNPLSARGIPTALRLKPDRPLVVNTLMGVTAVPSGFDRVRAIVPGPGGIEIRSASGKTVKVPLELDFLNQESGVRS
jgi:hypothetical protein